MTVEEKRNKQLLKNIQSIKTNINNLNRSYNKMIRVQKEALTFDNDIVDSNIQSNINNDMKDIVYELNWTVIPAIRRKI